MGQCVKLLEHYKLVSSSYKTQIVISMSQDHWKNWYGKGNNNNNNHIRNCCYKLLIMSVQIKYCLKLSRCLLTMSPRRTSTQSTMMAPSISHCYGTVYASHNNGALPGELESETLLKIGLITSGLALDIFWGFASSHDILMATINLKASSHLCCMCENYVLFN